MGTGGDEGGTSRVLAKFSFLVQVVTYMFVLLLFPCTCFLGILYILCIS